MLLHSIRIKGTEVIATVTEESPYWTLLRRALSMRFSVDYKSSLKGYISILSVVSGWSIPWLTWSSPFNNYRRNAENRNNHCTLLSLTSQKHLILWAETACSRYLTGLAVLWDSRLSSRFMQISRLWCNLATLIQRLSISTSVWSRVVCLHLPYPASSSVTLKFVFRTSTEINDIYPNTRTDRRLFSLSWLSKIQSPWGAH